VLYKLTGNGHHDRSPIHIDVWAKNPQKATQEPQRVGSFCVYMLDRHRYEWYSAGDTYYLPAGDQVVATLMDIRSGAIHLWAHGVFNRRVQCDGSFTPTCYRTSRDGTDGTGHRVFTPYTLKEMAAMGITFPGHPVPAQPRDEKGRWLSRLLHR
jgi:hypothetical protein